MALPQDKFREIVFQLLYSKTHGGTGEAELVDLLMRELKVTRKAVKQALERTDAVREVQDELDEKISEISTSFAFDRIHAVEKAILRLGLYELLYDDHIPPKVAISEAMRMARKFSTAEASGFVNALLDTLYKKSEGKAPDAAILERSAEALEQSLAIAKKAGEEAANGSDD